MTRKSEKNNGKTTTHLYERLGDDDRIRKVLELSSDYYWEQDSEHRFTLIRHRDAEKEDALASALFGKTWWELGGAPEQADDPGAGHVSPQLSQQPFNDLIVHYLIHGNVEKYFSISGQPVFDNGTFLGYWGVTRDVTEQKIQERLLRLEREIGRILLDVDKIADALREAIHAICLSEDWDAGQYWILDGESNVMRYFTGWNIDHEGAREIIDNARHFEFEKGSGLVGSVWESGETVWIRDLNKEKRLRREDFAAVTGWRQGLLFPVTSGGEVVGVLNFYAPRIQEPDERLLNFFQVVGALIGNYQHRLETVKQLEDSEERFHSTVDLAAIGIGHVDPDGVFIHVNRQLCEMLGYTKEELLGLSIREISHPEDIHVTNANRDKLLAGEIDSFTNEKRYIRKDGSTIWVRLAVAQKRNKKGETLYDISIIEDISERITMEEELRESEERYHSTVELAAIGIAHVDLKGDFIHVNPRFCNMLGYTHEELLSFSVKEISHPEDASLTNADRDRLRKGEIEFFKAEKRYIHKSGDIVWVSLTVTSKRDKQGDCLYDISIIEDITARVEAEQRVQYLATHDEMTDLPNRVLFQNLLSQAVESGKRYKREFAVIFIDLDRFKQINDTLGHEAGDILLIEMASRFKECLRSSDIVARLGGDEFVVLVQEISRLSQVALVAKNLLSAAIKPVSIKGQECRVTASLGVCMFPDGATDEQTLMKNADMAMYHAKGEGKNNFQFYSVNLASQSIEKMALETRLREAMANKEFELHYQAKMDIRTGEVAGVEALLRWNNPELGQVSPAHFIPIAEEMGLIIPLGLWVLKTACEQSISWQKQGLPPISISVNISPRQFASPDLTDQISRILEDTGLEPHLLELEVTESMIMNRTQEAVRKLTEFKNLGVRISIDDFGTGYSTLSQLKQFPIDTLKVDRSFIRMLPDNQDDQAVTEAIIAMGKTLGLTVIAEGVETQAQQQFLKDHACDELQGYLFSEPTHPDQLSALLQKIAGN